MSLIIDGLGAPRPTPPSPPTPERVDRFRGVLAAAARRHAVPAATAPVDGPAGTLPGGLNGVAPASATWQKRLPDAAGPWRAAIVDAAERHGVDPVLFSSLVWAESNFNHSTVSHAGAIGLGQLMPGTAAGLGVDPWDPLENLDGAARYLRAQLDRFGDETLALAAYNAGPNAVVRHGGVPPFAETQQYVRRIADYQQRLTGQGGT